MADRTLPGGGIIYAANDMLFIRERDKEIPRSLRYKPLGSLALLGSDVIDEQPSSNLAIEPLEPVVSEAGQKLRFALLARTDRLEAVESKLNNGSPLRIGTSYPIAMDREMRGLDIPVLLDARNIVSGKVEKMLYEDERQLDVVFEQIQSGASAEAMDLTILIDNLAPVSLIKVVMMRKSCYQ